MQLQCSCCAAATGCSRQVANSNLIRAIHRHPAGYVEGSRKVEELALRGMTLSSLLQFYQEDLVTMPDWRYSPKDHKTTDVVRGAIIPLTCEEESSYAGSALNRDGLRRPHVMVTHTVQDLSKFLALLYFNAATSFLGAVSRLSFCRRSTRNYIFGRNYIEQPR